MPGEGKCLCGAVQLSAPTVSPNLGVCHCTMCRKWSGGPYFAIDCGKEISWRGEDAISIYSSSAWAERGFCKRCGTHLFYRLKATQQYFVAAGLFDDPATFQFNHQIFIDEKPAYYNFAEKTHNLTGAEIFAKFSQG